ncbi:winged helix-turn-helix transcriptional regulator [Leucobacter coleopterorum]|uniref:Winged helix-turn-helix transcriptional regulator n=1 Tax=Leucobacter coleopterorum TaxID=2714933 RepID=A0ABX6JWC6_9MICO|nr:MarR family winged helix-turn-helix transcriptional regulator [Leucobacter coleopterorum]QIM18606.1 winged helix-turn-helix transcriptional regulator [Leucobacter coleopterorum]
MTGTLNTSYPDPNMSTGLMLWRVTNSWQREIRATLAPFGLTHVQFVLLAALTAMDSETPVTQRDLAEQAVTDPMMTSQVLRALEEKDLVERHPHPTDRRARTLAVTPAGVALANRANAAVEQADHAYFFALGRKRQDFTDCLATLSAAADISGKNGSTSHRTESA